MYFFYYYVVVNVLTVMSLAFVSAPGDAKF